LAQTAFLKMALHTVICAIAPLENIHGFVVAGQALAQAGGQANHLEQAQTIV
jgi:hypothetical protein